MVNCIRVVNVNPALLFCSINDWLNNDAVFKHALYDRELKRSFQEWLKSCHLQFDQENEFRDRLEDPNPNDYARFNTVKLGDKTFTAGNLLKLRYRESIFVKVVEFHTVALEAQRTTYHGKGDLVYIREPRELFGMAKQVHNRRSIPTTAISV